MGASLVALVVPAASALWAIRQAVILPAATAMLPAPPPGYRKASGESIPAFRWVGGPTRIIVRHLARWPLRATFTMCAIAMAIALQVSTLFSFDALDYMIDRFYARSQRQDLTIVFGAPQPMTTVKEARHWPGVRQLEPYRSVPAQLTSAIGSRSVEITGLPATADLTRVCSMLRWHQPPSRPKGLRLRPSLQRCSASRRAIG